MKVSVKRLQRTLSAVAFGVAVLTLMNGGPALYEIYRIHDDPRYTEGTVVSVQREAGSQSNTWVNVHRVVSRSAGLGWTFSLHQNTHFEEGTSLQILYAGSDPEVARIWPGKAPADGRPELLKLILEDDWVVPIVLMPFALLAFLLLLHPSTGVILTRMLLTDQNSDRPGSRR